MPVLLLSLALAGCGDDDSPAADAGPNDAGSRDASAADAGAPAAGATDGGAVDAETADAAAGDGGSLQDWDAGLGIPCGAATCTAGDQVCCHHDGDAGPPTCVAAEDCAPPSIRVYCDGPEDCASGELCCSGGNSRECVSMDCSNPVCRTIEDCRPFFGIEAVECNGEEADAGGPPAICVPIV